MLLRGRRLDIVMGQILCGESKAPEASVTMHPLAAAMGKGINLGNLFERKKNVDDDAAAAAAAVSFSCSIKIHFTGDYVDPTLNLTIVNLPSVVWVVWSSWCRSLLLALPPSPL